MSSKRITDIFDVAVWIYGRKDLGLMDEVVLAAKPEDVVSTIDQLDMPQPLKLPLLLAWASLHQTRENLAASARGERPTIPELTHYVLTLGRLYRIRAATLSFQRLPQIMHRHWVLEGTIPHIIDPMTNPFTGPEGAASPVSQGSHVIERSRWLDRLIQLETQLTLNMPSPRPIQIVSMDIQIPM